MELNGLQYQQIKNSGKLINETLISYNENWKDKHLSIIKQSFYKTKYEEDILS